MNQNLLNRFRKIAVLEGISFIVLLFIAMPLKYFANMPWAVKYVGWAHGVLFILFVYFLLKVWLELEWKFLKVAFAFILSLLPFGTFYLEYKLKNQKF